MRSSDRHPLRWILALLIAAALFFALDLLLYPCTFMRNDVHALAAEQNDVLILGTSNGKMDLDPACMLEGTGLTGHNADVRSLIEKVREEEGDIVCGRLLAQGKKPCPDMVADAAGMLSEVL